MIPTDSSFLTVNKLNRESGQAGDRLNTILRQIQPELELQWVEWWEHYYSTRYQPGMPLASLDGLLSIDNSMDDFANFIREELGTLAHNIGLGDDESVPLEAWAVCPTIEAWAGHYSVSFEWLEDYGGRSLAEKLLAFIRLDPPPVRALGSICDMFDQRIEMEDHE